MKTALMRLFFLGMALALMAAACGPRPRPGIAPLPKHRAAADDLFQRAERSFGQNAYEEALALYSDYLARYPDERSEERRVGKEC